jgi:hypothetical protein
MGSDTRNITLLRGIVSVALHVNGVKTGWRDLGEVPKFDMPATELTNIDVFTSRDYSGSLVKRIATKTVPKLTISGLEIGPRNLALQVLGFSELLEQEAGTATVVQLTDDMEFDRAYELGFENVSAVLIPTLTEGDDFVVDAELGLVTFLADGDAVEGNTYSTSGFSYGASTSEVISIAGAREVHASFKLVGATRDPEDDDIVYDAKIWHAQIQPSEVLSLITAPDANAPASWGISADIIADPAGLFGGNTRYKYGQIIKRARQSEVVS